MSYPIKDLGLVFVFGAMWGPIYTAFRKIMPLPKIEGYHSGHQLTRRSIIAILILMFFAGAYGTYSQFIRTPVALAASPANGTKLTDLTSPITITFDKPIDRNLLKLSISPAVSGDLSFSDPYMQRTLDRKVTFTPQSHLSPDTTYTVHVANIQNVLGRQAGTLQFTFRTPSLPAVASISIRNEQKNVAICDPVTVILNQPANKLEAFNFKLSPTIPITATLGQDSRTFTLIPKNCLSQNTPYTFTVQRRLTVYNETGRLINSTEPYVTLETIAFTTKAAPGISGFTPQGEGILSSIKQFEVLFSEPMDISDSTSGLSVQPAVSGTWHWLNSRTLRYDLSGSLQLDTAYTITVPHGFKDARNGFLVRDTLFSFRTLGHMQIVSISPKSSSGNLAINTPIRISFDQPVDQNSAQQNFSINPAVSGSFSWQGQTMLYSATLSKDSSYQIIEKAGVVSQIGLPSQAAISTSFQTEESVLLLNIPVYYQQKPLSCEVASLKMALNYKGSSISEAALFNGLGNDTTPRQGDTWGDPYQFFVGDANGHQNTTGYGVYAGPIAAVSSQYRSAQSLSGMSTSQVAGYLAQGNPVIFWGTAGNAKPDQWTTTGGRQINGWIGEHVRLLVGFNGPASHPTAFTINDPIFGRLKWTASQLQANWSAFNGMGVVIF